MAGTKKTSTIIGVHMRRGDFTEKENREFGHYPADENLLERGMKYFEKK